MRKIAMLLLILITFLLLVPVPYYEKYDAFCSPCPPTGSCSPCPKKGWHFQKPLLWQLIDTLNLRQQTKVKSEPVIQSTPKNNQVVIDPQLQVKDQYDLKDLRVKGDILTLTVSYSGGCQEHTFKLFTNGQLKQSVPLQMDLYLYHDAQNDACEAYLTETFDYDLSPLKERLKETKLYLLNFHDYQGKIYPIKYQIF